MNRKRSQTNAELQQSAQKRRQVRSELIRGRITRLIYPTHYIECSGGATNFAILEIDGHIVKGNFPLIDPFLCYEFKAHLEEKWVGRRLRYHWEIDGEVKYISPPLDVITLTRILSATLGKKMHDASEIARSVHKTFGASGGVGKLDAGWIQQHFGGSNAPGWLRELRDYSNLFKCQLYKQLENFWSVEDLRVVSADQLSLVLEQLEHDAFAFAFHWKTPFGLPELTLEQVEKAAKLLPRSSISPNRRRMIAAYQNFKAYTQRTGGFTVPLSYARENGWPLDLAECKRAGVFHVFGAVRPADATHSNAYSEPLLYLEADVQRLKHLKEALTKLLYAQTVNDVKLRAQLPNIDRLNERQMAAYTALFQQNLIIVRGVAGTGKTELAKLINETYPKKAVLNLANFGVAAENLAKHLENGSTIDKLETECRRRGAEGKKARKLCSKATVVLIDETPTLTLRLLDVVLRRCKNIRKLILLGDEKQLPPPGGGSVLLPLLERYGESQLTHQLVTIVRAEEERIELRHNQVILSSETLADRPLVPANSTGTAVAPEETNAAATQALFEEIDENILDEDFDFVAALEAHTEEAPPSLKFGTRLEEPTSFVILPRPHIDKIHLNDRNKYQRQRLSWMRQILEPIYDRYAESDVALFAQRNIDCDDMNMLWYCFKFGETQLPKRNLFRIGELIRCSKRRYGNATQAKIYAGEVACSDIRNGTRGRIARIADVPINQDMLEESVDYENTLQGNTPPGFCRMIYLENGDQINLNLYALQHVHRNYAMTISSAQGCECDIGFWLIHPFYSSYLTLEHMRVAISRARQRTIVCGSEQDMINISQNPYEHPRNDIERWLPEFDPTLQKFVEEDAGANEDDDISESLQSASY